MTKPNKKRNLGEALHSIIIILPFTSLNRASLETHHPGILESFSLSGSVMASPFASRSYSERERHHVPGVQARCGVICWHPSCMKPAGSLDELAVAPQVTQQPSLTCSASHCRSFFWMVRSCFSAMEAVLSAASVAPAPAVEVAAPLSSSAILRAITFFDLLSGIRQVQAQKCRAGSGSFAWASCVSQSRAMSGAVSMLGHVDS